MPSIADDQPASRLNSAGIWIAVANLQIIMKKMKTLWTGSVTKIYFQVEGQSRHNNQNYTCQPFRHASFRACGYFLGQREMSSTASYLVSGPHHNFINNRIISHTSWELPEEFFFALRSWWPVNERSLFFVMRKEFRTYLPFGKSYSWGRCSETHRLWLTWA